ncbi:MAG TPA: membrane protein insertase YidC [Acidimicrobiales bacterium]
MPGLAHQRQGLLLMFDLFASMLAWFYDLVPNYAVAIALFTLTIMIVLTPLTLKGTKGMLELQRLQPEIKRLQQEHKGDRQKLNEEMMRLYQEHKVNPLGGCLPLLLQAPIFIILFQVLRGLTRTCSPGLQAEGVCTTVGNFAPKYLDQATRLFKDLSSTDEMRAFGLDLARPATDVIRDSLVQGLPYLALVLLVAATSYIQQWQITRRNSGMAANPQQQMIMKLMPAFFAIISISMPAGLIFYFLVSNLYRIAQQAYITRRFYRGEVAAERAAAIEAASKKAPPPKSGPAKGSPPKSAKPGPASKPSPSDKPPASSKPAPKSTAASPPKNRPTPSQNRPTPSRPSRPTGKAAPTTGTPPSDSSAPPTDAKNPSSTKPTPSRPQPPKKS